MDMNESNEEFDWSQVELEGDDEEEESEAGAPEWMITFADLMTLLMCFFILLVAFSELDIKRYRMIAGSMKEAFGVQRDVRAFEQPKGTSFIAQEYSSSSKLAQVESARDVRSGDTDEQRRTKSAEAERRAEKTREEVASLNALLGEFIETGIAQVEGGEDRIVIRVQETGLFRSGKAVLKRKNKKMLRELGEALNEIPGLVTVSGHTDDIPLRSKRFRSNWDLSSARAATVVELFREKAGLPGNRLAAIGYADTRPVAPNDTPENRADNRRVEINIIKRSHNQWGQAENIIP